eukprot:g1129.t1
MDKFLSHQGTKRKRADGAASSGQDSLGFDDIDDAALVAAAEAAESAAASSSGAGGNGDGGGEAAASGGGRRVLSSAQRRSAWNEELKERFLVAMPPCFFDLWDLACELKPSDPAAALQPIGVAMVGPYDYLAGKLDGKGMGEEQYAVHWRYFYDPPEFQTVLTTDRAGAGGKDGLHWGYFRDDPEAMPVGVASNHPKLASGTFRGDTEDMDGVGSRGGGGGRRGGAGGAGASFRRCGSNVLAALHARCEAMADGPAVASQRRERERIRAALERRAAERALALDAGDAGGGAGWRTRKKTLVAQTFTGLGMVVPVDKEQDVGYRPLPNTDRELKAAWTRVQDAPRGSRDTQSLDEIVTWATIANDECDFGMALHLGQNLLAHERQEGRGCELLRRYAEDLLPITYMLLDRAEFGTIVEAHLKHRRTARSLDAAEAALRKARGEGTSAARVARYDTLDAVLADDTVAVVLLTLPTPAMPSAVAQCLRAGRHVLSEKPAGASKQQLRALWSTYEACAPLVRTPRAPRAPHAAQSPAVPPAWCVLEGWALKDGVLRLRELLQCGAAGGELQRLRYSCHVTRHLPAPAAEGGGDDWRQDPCTAAGQRCRLLDIGVHIVRALRVLFGDVDGGCPTVTSRADPPGGVGFGIRSDLCHEHGANGTLELTIIHNVGMAPAAQAKSDCGAVLRVAEECAACGLEWDMDRGVIARYKNDHNGGIIGGAGADGGGGGGACGEFTDVRLPHDGWVAGGVVQALRSALAHCAMLQYGRRAHDGGKAGALAPCPVTAEEGVRDALLMLEILAQWETNAMPPPRFAATVLLAPAATVSSVGGTRTHRPALLARCSSVAHVVAAVAAARARGLRVVAAGTDHSWSACADSSGCMRVETALMRRVVCVRDGLVWVEPGMLVRDLARVLAGHDVCLPSLPMLQEQSLGDDDFGSPYDSKHWFPHGAGTSSLLRQEREMLLSREPGLHRMQAAPHVSAQYSVPLGALGALVESLEQWVRAPSGGGAAFAGRVVELKFLRGSGATLLAANSVCSGSGEASESDTIVVCLNVWWRASVSYLYRWTEQLHAFGARPHQGKVFCENAGDDNTGELVAPLAASRAQLTRRFDAAIGELGAFAAASNAAGAAHCVAANVGDLPRLIVILPSFNAMPWLPIAVRDIIRQNGVAVELFVADDASTDGSRRWLCELVAAMRAGGHDAAAEQVVMVDGGGGDCKGVECARVGTGAMRARDAMVRVVGSGWDGWGAATWHARDTAVQPVVDVASTNPAHLLPERTGADFGADESAPPSQARILRDGPMLPSVVAAQATPGCRLRVLQRVQAGGDDSQRPDPVNRGQGAAMTLALRRALELLAVQGDGGASCSDADALPLVCFMESDDERLAGSLRLLVRELLLHGDWDGVVSNTRCIGWKRPGMERYCRWQATLGTAEELRAARFVEIPALMQAGVYRLRAVLRAVMHCQGGDGCSIARSEALERVHSQSFAFRDDSTWAVDMHFWLSWFDAGLVCGKLPPVAVVPEVIAAPDRGPPMRSIEVWSTGQTATKWIDDLRRHLHNIGSVAGVRVEKCDGSFKCSVRVNNELEQGGDPAEGCNKQAEVTYRCGSDGAVKRATLASDDGGHMSRFGGRVGLWCPKGLTRTCEVLPGAKRQVGAPVSGHQQHANAIDNLAGTIGYGTDNHTLEQCLVECADDNRCKQAWFKEATGACYGSTAASALNEHEPGLSQVGWSTIQCPRLPEPTRACETFDTSMKSLNEVFGPSTNNEWVPELGRTKFWERHNRGVSVPITLRHCYSADDAHDEDAVAQGTARKTSTNDTWIVGAVHSGLLKMALIDITGAGSSQTIESRTMPAGEAATRLCDDQGVFGQTRASAADTFDCWEHAHRVGHNYDMLLIAKRHDIKKRSVAEAFQDSTEHVPFE